MTTGAARRTARLCIGATALALVGACADFDIDLRDLGNGPDTSAAALSPVADRPLPDDRGVISYPNYQVAVARRGDTVTDVAARVGLPPEDLARFNGAPANAVLNRGEVLALPRRVAEPSPATGAAATGPILPAGEVNVSALAGAAINRAEVDGQQTIQRASPPPSVQTGEEPIRHRVARGETAFSISRRYGVPVDALAEWNGLNQDRTVRVGQYLLIPPSAAAASRQTAAAAPVGEAVSAPGAGSSTPAPPSAAQPLPEDQPARTTAEPATTQEVPDSPNLGTDTTSASASTAQFETPVSAPIIRDFARGRHDGLDYGAAPGTSVRAAEAGTVAFITEDTAAARVILVRHAGGLSTIYGNVKDLSVSQGDRVRKGQEIAKVGDAEPPVFRFQVRDGVEAVDPNPYLN
ncbi:MAG: M23 family metallopeptidase [Pseudomonadota bacterium]